MELYCNQIILQPTTKCNLNCKYCYLPDRQQKQFMTNQVTERLAKDIELFDSNVTLIWHGGEPLLTGLTRFKELISPLYNLYKSGKIKFGLQTNGTLITKEWCDFFKEYNFSIGLSIDGDLELNKNRVTWSDNPAYNQIINGIDTLNQNKVSFSVIAVVGSQHIGKEKEFYSFLTQLGTKYCGLNIEEIEGVNSYSTFDKTTISEFWKNLFLEWKKNPKIRIREFSNAISWLYKASKIEKSKLPQKQINLIPTIDIRGNVFFLSPELAGVKSSKYNDFIIGNILSDSLSNILENGKSSIIFHDYLKGIEKCSENCGYFSFCGGGQASNKFAEHCTLDIDETTYCIYHRKELVNSLLNCI